MVTYSSITITDLQDGSQFWTTSVAPSTPNYTFLISNLHGDTNADIKVGDIILYSHYRYTVYSVSSSTVLATDRVSLKGTDGISPSIKSIECSHAAAVCSKDGVYNPEQITFYGKIRTQEEVDNYQGYFKIELSPDGTTWISTYTSASKESSTTYTIPLGVNINKNGVIFAQGSTVTTGGTVIDANFTITSDGVVTTASGGVGFIIRSIRCSLYSDAQLTNMVDQQRVNIAFDGVDGAKGDKGENGDDGYTITLTNENYTFSGNTTNAIASNNLTKFNVAECEVITLIGGEPVPCFIGTITGMPTGMNTPTISNNRTTSAKFTVTVTAAMTTQNGTLNVPVTVNENTNDAKTFNMIFSYSLKLNGLDATGLGWTINHDTFSGTTNNGECYYHGFDDATKEGADIDGWVWWNGDEVTIPKGCHINPNTTMPYNQTIYSVYRLNNPSNLASGGVFHDVAWVTTTNNNISTSKWQSNTYSGTTPTKDSTDWIWNEATDIILAMYEEPSSEGAIINAQLFTPPKKCSELVEFAKGMAQEADNKAQIADGKAEVADDKAEAADAKAEDAKNYANYYMKLDNTGVMFSNMVDESSREYTPSTIPTGKYNVLIRNNDILIRNGQTSLASYGTTITLGKTGTNNRNIYIDSNSVNIRNGSTVLASYGDTITLGKTATGENNVYIDSNGINIRNGTTSISHFGNDIIIGKTGSGEKNINISSTGIQMMQGAYSIANFGDSVRIGDEGNNNIVITSNDFSGNKYTHVGNTVKSVEVFKISSGSESTIEESEIVSRTSFNTPISLTYTCSGNISNSSTIYMRGEAILANDDHKYSVSLPRIYNTSRQQSESISYIIEWVDATNNNRTQHLRMHFSWDISSKATTFTVDEDDGNNSSNRVVAIRLHIRFLEGETLYPFYRFGTFNEYSSTDLQYIAGNFAFDIGENNIPSGNYSFTHGVDNTASGFGSFSSGGYCSAMGDYSFAEGNGCLVSGSCSSAIGIENTVNGDYSFVGGIGNISRYDGQTIFGSFAPIATSDDVFLIGIGYDESNRAYAMRLKNNGRVEFNGAVGSGLTWDSRTEMINVVKDLSLKRPYNFFASSTVSGGSTIYWGTTAGATASNAFGTICRMSTTAWHMFFMCGGNMYKSIFNWDDEPTKTGTFTTIQIG